MKHTRFILILILMVCFQNHGICNNKFDQENGHHYKHSLGFGAGFTTGAGISYRFVPKKFGIQLNYSVHVEDKHYFKIIGVSFLYNYYEGKALNLFAYQGNCLLYESSGEINIRDFFCYGNGLGLGIEIIAVKRISFNFMLGYALYDNFRIPFFTAETGIYYRF